MHREGRHRQLSSVCLSNEMNITQLRKLTENHILDTWRYMDVVDMILAHLL